MQLLPSFFKPPAGNYEPLYSSVDKSLSGTISFRSLHLEKDLAVIHSWVTQPYAARYWQLNVEQTELASIYQAILDNLLAHSFIGLFNDSIVCQVDCYHASTEEIKDHVELSPGACGFHILMLPPKESFRGLTEAMLRSFTRFFFWFEEAETLYGEPDANNTPANLAARRAGFNFQKTIQLSYKTANLYSITKEQFHATNSIL